MANLNKVMLIGRLTRDPEIRTFATGGKVANFGFAVNNPKKNQSTGQWESEPVFVDIEAFNRQNGRQLADLVEQYLHKGNQAYIEGHLKLNQWTSQDGQKQSRLRIVLDDVQFLEPRADGGSGEGGSRFQKSGSPNRAPMNAPQVAGQFDDHPPEHEAFGAAAAPPEQDIPF